MANATSGPPYSRERHSLAIVREAVWDPGQVWTVAENLDPRTVQPGANGYIDYTSVSQPPGRGIIYTGPREVLLEFVILVF